MAHDPRRTLTPLRGDCAGRAWGGGLSGGRSNNRHQDVFREDPGGRGGKLGEGGRVSHRTLCAPSDPGDVASWLGSCSACSHGTCVFMKEAGGTQAGGTAARRLGQASSLGSAGRAWRGVTMLSLGPAPLPLQWPGSCAGCVPLPPHCDCVACLRSRLAVACHVFASRPSSSSPRPAGAPAGAAGAGEVAGEETPIDAV